MKKLRKIVACLEEKADRNCDRIAKLERALKIGSCGTYSTYFHCKNCHVEVWFTIPMNVKVDSYLAKNKSTCVECGCEFEKME